MKTYNIHEARARLSRLVEDAAQGRDFVIAKAGKPMVKVVPLCTPRPGPFQRFGFMAGEILIPEDFNTMGAAKDL